MLSHAEDVSEPLLAQGPNLDSQDQRIGISQRVLEAVEQGDDYTEIELADSYKIRVPSKFIDTISTDIKKIPVLASDGREYDGETIVRCMQARLISPLDNITRLEKRLTFTKDRYDQIRAFFKKMLREIEMTNSNQSAIPNAALTIIKSYAQGLTRADTVIIAFSRKCQQNDIALSGLNVLPHGISEPIRAAEPNPNRESDQTEDSSFLDFWLVLSSYYSCTLLGEGGAMLARNARSSGRINDPFMDFVPGAIFQATLATIALSFICCGPKSFRRFLPYLIFSLSSFISMDALATFTETPDWLPIVAASAATTISVGMTCLAGNRSTRHYFDFFRPAPISNDNQSPVELNQLNIEEIPEEKSAPRL